MASSLPIVRPMSLYLSVKKIVRGFTLFCFAPTAPPPPAQNPICCRCY
jgi:hypothetical protein